MSGSSFTYITTATTAATNTYVGASGGGGGGNTSGYSHAVFDQDACNTPLGGNWSSTCPGHLTGSENIEYFDGKVIAYCVRCNARIEVERFPGGLSVVHARELAERIIVGLKEQENTGETLAELSDLLRDIKAEQEALNEVQALLKTIEILVDE